MAKVPEHTKKESKILPCKCTETKEKKKEPAIFQDEKHGKGLRVHNPGAKGYMCTVCGEAKVYTGDVKKEEKKEDKKK